VAEVVEEAMRAATKERKISKAPPLSASAFTVPAGWRRGEYLVRQQLPDGRWQVQPSERPPMAELGSLQASYWRQFESEAEMKRFLNWWNL
jgi:hypothetical protein